MSVVYMRTVTLMPQWQPLAATKEALICKYTHRQRHFFCEVQAMPSTIDSTGSPLARMAEEQFHKTLEDENGQQSMREFATHFSLGEWRAASNFMGKGKQVSDLSVSESSDTLELHGSPEALNKQIAKTTERYDHLSLVTIPGVALVAASLLLKNTSAGRLCAVFGGAWTATGLANYYEAKPQIIKGLNSLSNVVIDKSELKPDLVSP
jgi:hypothetical protein